MTDQRARREVERVRDGAADLAARTARAAFRSYADASIDVVQIAQMGG
jgi:hypothetical protein